MAPRLYLIQLNISKAPFHLHVHHLNNYTETLLLSFIYMYINFFSGYIIFSDKYFFSDSPWDTWWAAVGTRGDLGRGAAEGVRRGSRSGWHRRCSSCRGSWGGASTRTRGPRWGSTLGSGTRHGRSVEKIKKIIILVWERLFDRSIYLSIYLSMSCTSFSFFLSLSVRLPIFQPVCLLIMLKMPSSKLALASWMNEWMMHLYSALLCIAVHPKLFTIMWGGGLCSTTTSVQHPLGWCGSSHHAKFMLNCVSNA